MANGGLPPRIYWPLKEIAETISTGKTKRYGKYDLCTTPWSDKFTRSRDELRKPFGYHRSKIVFCHDKISIRLANHNNPPESWNETLEEEPALGEKWKQGVRVFCHGILNITGEILDSMQKAEGLLPEKNRRMGEILREINELDAVIVKLEQQSPVDEKKVLEAKLIRRKLRDEKYEVIWLEGFLGNHLDKDESYYQTGNFQLIGQSVWSGDWTWATILGREINGCPPERDKQKWVDVSDATKIPGFDL